MKSVDEIKERIKRNQIYLHELLLAVSPAISLTNHSARILLSIAGKNPDSADLLPTLNEFTVGNMDEFYLSLTKHQELLAEWRKETEESLQISVWEALRRHSEDMASDDNMLTQSYYTCAVVYGCQTDLHRAEYQKKALTMLESGALHKGVIWKARELGLTEQMNLPEEFVASL